MKYSCKLSKQEMMEIIVNHFYEVNAEYDQVHKDPDMPEFLRHRTEGQYMAIQSLLCKLHIQEKED